MTNRRYKHKVGVRAEICFEVILDTSTPTATSMRDAVLHALEAVMDEDEGFALTVLPEGHVYPDWNSVDRKTEPHNVLDPGAVRVFDSFEVEST